MPDSMTQLLKNATEMQVYPSRNDWGMNTENPQPMRDLWQGVKAAALRAELFNGDEKMLMSAENDDRYYHIKKKGFVATAHNTVICSGNWSMCFPLTSLGDEAWIVRLDCFNFANHIDLAPIPTQLPVLTLREFFTQLHTHYIFNIETKSLIHTREDSFPEINIIKHVSRDMIDNEHRDIIPRALAAKEKDAASKSAAQENCVNHGSPAPWSADNPGRLDDRDARMAFPPSERSSFHVFGSDSHLETGQKSFERIPLDPSTGQALPQSKAFHLGTDHNGPSAKRRRANLACLTCIRRKARCSGEQPTCWTCVMDKYTCDGYGNTKTFQEILDRAEKRGRVMQPGASPAVETEQPEQTSLPAKAVPQNPPPFRTAQNHGFASTPMAAYSTSAIAAESGSYKGGEVSQTATTKTGYSIHSGERNWGLEVEHAHWRLGMLESVVEGLTTENANLKIRLEIVERMLGSEGNSELLSLRERWRKAEKQS